MSAAKTLLIEIGCEDLPARYVEALAEALWKGIVNGLTKQGIALQEPRRFSTPRRIAVFTPGVEERQRDQLVERKGPVLAAAYRDGQPTPAALGFARKCGVDVSRLKKENGQLVYREIQKGRRTLELIPEIFEGTLKQMDELVPKRMRWGTGEETFVRPVQWLLALYGNKIIHIERFGLKAGNKTYGHRFHAPKAITLKSPVEYEAKLRAAKVWADFASRRDEIWRQVEAEAKKLGGRPDRNEQLLDEVTALVEWPVAVSGRIEERFLQLPPEVVIATVEHNQRYFPVFDRAGKLLPAFITVTNIESKDVSQIIAGNERVVRPRLADALFFWEKDRELRFALYAGRLNGITFQKDLGTVAAKVERIENLATAIALSPGVFAEGPKLAPLARLAASLCKNDLVTRMVFEFPELQGIMGGYYAEASGESRDAAQAIREHYQPTQAGGPIPSTRIGQIVALADKLDTLAGIFAIGQKPTASKDPFGLRRAALGILRICIEGKLALDIRALLQPAVEAQPAGRRDGKLADEAWDFVLDRLRGLLAEQGVAAEVINAVAATGTTVPLDFAARIEAVSAFLKLPESAQLAAAHKRIRNILRQAGDGDARIVTDRFEHDAERALFDALNRLAGGVETAASKADYTGGLITLAQLQAPVDAFFDRVMVMAEDAGLRANRLALLRNLDRLCRSIADISCLPG